MVKIDLLKQIITILLLCLSCHGYTQDSKYSVELNYPIQVGSNFINDNYTGLLDLGFKARFLRTNHVNIGFQANCSVFDFNGPKKESSFKTLYVILPKFYVELNSLKKIRPFVGVGYALMTYRKSGDVDDGPNIGLGLSYDINEKLFAQIQYDVILGTSSYGTRFTTFEGILPETLDSDNNILKLGIGYRL